MSGWELGTDHLHRTSSSPSAAHLQHTSSSTLIINQLLNFTSPEHACKHACKVQQQARATKLVTFHTNDAVI
jgi:hypothetical protein